MENAAGRSKTGLRGRIGRITAAELRRWRRRLAERLNRWSRALDPAVATVAKAAQTPRRPLAPATAARAQLPGVRLPLSMEQAVRRRNLPVLRREAADALAAFGAAHALVASSRFTQLQDRRQEARGEETDGEELASLAADYLGWQGDQVRLFDALGMVLAMRVPYGSTLEQIDPALRPAAEEHLASLTVEYQRRLLVQQFGNEPAPTEGMG